MKKFLYSIILFVLPVWALLTVADYYYSQAATKSNYFHIEAWHDLMHGKIDADVVIMGSSRAWVHINPIILDSILGVNSYNLGIDGSTINRQIKKYNIFRRYNKKPKLIIQNIDHCSLGHGVGYEREQFFPYFWDKAIREEFYSSEPITIWEKYIPFYRYYHNFDNETLHGMVVSTTRKLTKGYEGQERCWDGSGYRKVQSIKFAPNDTTLAMFDDYLAKTKAECIKVLFVYTPLYIGATRKIENLKEMHDKYQEYADKYDIPILDYTYMDICYDTTYFYNAMHLTKTGAEVFSDSLANDIKRLGIINK